MSNHNEYSSFAEVLGLCGITYPPNKIEIKIDCPECGHHALGINLNKNTGLCYHCNAGYNYTSFYAKLNNCTNKTAEKEIRAHFHREREKQYVPKKVKEEEVQAKLINIDERATQYQMMLDALPLSDRHLNDLINRKLNILEIQKLAYKTYSLKTVKERKAFSKKINANLGVPGFYEEEDGSVCINYVKESILVPYRNRHNQICGLQCRINNELVKTKDDTKYIWFSTKQRKNGCSSGIMIHYACDFYYNLKNKEIEPVLGKSIRITEGGMKGDIIHVISGEPVICIPGTKCLKALTPELKYLKERGVEEIIDTFDMDYISNEGVAKDVEKLKETIVSAGLKYRRIDWDSRYKGYDDYLAKDRQIVI